MLVLVCGDRNWDDRKTIYLRLEKLPVGSVVMHGGCQGADEIAGIMAGRLGFEVRVFEADWDEFGKAAGPIRNRQMLDQKPDLVIAFHLDLKKSRGTRNCLEVAEQRGIETELIPPF